MAKASLHMQSMSILEREQNVGKLIIHLKKCKFKFHC